MFLWTHHEHSSTDPAEGHSKSAERAEHIHRETEHQTLHIMSTCLINEQHSLQYCHFRFSRNSGQVMTGYTRHSKHRFERLLGSFQLRYPPQQKRIHTTEQDSGVPANRAVSAISHYIDTEPTCWNSRRNHTHTGNTLSHE